MIQKAERDGYFVVPGFFDTALVEKTRQQLVALLDEDVRLREEQDLPKRYVKDDHVVSGVSPLIHTRFFPLWESDGLQTMAEELFTHSGLREVTDHVIGEHFRLRVDLVRRATGQNDWVDDFQIPHAWHRDTPGEFTFGIFFDDLTPPNSGGTAVISGSHWMPQHPHWDLALSEDSWLSKEHFSKKGPKRLDPELYRWMLTNRFLRRRLGPKAQEIRGRPGDLYLFLNDLWHGRAANIHGEKNVMVRMGGFASEFEFKDDLGLPPGADALPEAVAQHYRPDQPENSDPSTVLRRIQHRRRRPGFVSLAEMEKRLAVRVTERRHAKQRSKT